MEEESDSNGTLEDVYLYLDFNKKVKDEALLNKMFFRIANIDSENPLVQLNDHLFKGHYEDCIGTNLFFEDVEEPEPRCIFEGESSIRLKHTVTQFKTLALRPVKIPSKLRDIPQPEYDIKINDNYDYDTLLKKLADQSLKLEDDLKVVPKGSKELYKQDLPNPNQINNAKEKSIKSEVQMDVDLATTNESNHQKNEICFVDVNFCDESERSGNNNLNSREDSDFDPSKQPEQTKVEPVDILTYKYEKLQKLARIPVRRKIIPETVSECEPKYQKAYEYNCIKSQIIKPSPYFPTISKDFNKDTLVGAVDIDRSVIQGVIKPSSEYHRILTEEEKSALLSMHNLENLSMPARYWVLRSQMDHLEALQLTSSDEELAMKDEYGRTIEDTIGIYKRLLRVLNGIIHDNYFYNSEEDTDDDDDSSDDNSVRDIIYIDMDPAGDVSHDNIEDE